MIISLLSLQLLKYFFEMQIIDAIKLIWITSDLFINEYFFLNKHKHTPSGNQNLNEWTWDANQ